MKLAFFQYDVASKDKIKNLEKIYVNLQQSNFDLIVLPELCTSGYLFNNKKEVELFAEKIPNGETTELISELAKKKSAYIVAGMIEYLDGKIYNSAIIAGPSGYIGKYQKRHLAPIEKKLFESGTDIPVFKVENYRVGIQICFDVWFPEASRILLDKGTDIICHPSNFGGSKTNLIARTRSIENSVYTITSNRIGKEKISEVTADFRGESQIVDYSGDVILKAGSNEELFVTEVNIIPDRKKMLLGASLRNEIKKYN